MYLPRISPIRTEPLLENSQTVALELPDMRHLPRIARFPQPAIAQSKTARTIVRNSDRASIFEELGCTQGPCLDSEFSQNLLPLVYFIRTPRVILGNHLRKRQHRVGECLLLFGKAYVSNL